MEAQASDKTWAKICNYVGDNGAISTTDLAAVTCDKNEAVKCDEVRHNVNCSDTDGTVYDSFLII